MSPLVLFGALGVTSIGIVGLVYLSGETAITCIPLSKEEDQSTYQSKFGGNNKDKLVSTKKTENKDWWNKRYKEAYPKETAEKPTDKFKDVDKGWGNDDKALNKVCEGAYSQTNDNNGSIKSSNATNTQYLESNIWKFCSISGKQDS